MNIRRAKPIEASILSGIAIRSKAYWGYDDAFMELCRNALTITEEKIIQHHVYLAMEGPNYVGFYSLVSDGTSGILDDLFVSPPYIGNGCGRILWESMLKIASELGIREITIKADSNAEGFYLKMGAERIGDAESPSIPGYILPLLRAVVTAQD